MPPAARAFVAVSGLLAATRSATGQVGAWWPPADPSRYHVTLYGSDAGPLRPFRTHTWATFARETPTPAGTAVETFTISWLPADGRINRLRPFRPEPGRNYGPGETLGLVTAQGQRVAGFGPIAITPAAFAAAADQAARLDSGAVSYRAVDAFGRRPWLSHCVHAVTDPLLGGRQPPLRIGRRGTAVLAGQIADSGAAIGPP